MMGQRVEKEGWGRGREVVLSPPPPPSPDQALYSDSFQGRTRVFMDYSRAITGPYYVLPLC